MADNDQAIVVGIGRYPRFKGDPLPGAITDANMMADWLAHSAMANVTLITSEGLSAQTGKETYKITDLRPHRSDIDIGFSGYTTNGNGRQGRRLYIYLAGHGFMPDYKSLALITAEASGDKFLPNIDGPGWAMWFADQLYFDEIVLWMDCCATRAYRYELGAPTVDSAAGRQNGRAKLFCGFAAQPSQKSFEGPYGKNGETMGLFTAQLLRGLEGAAADAQNNVTSESLKKFMKTTLGAGTDGGTPAGSTVRQPPEFPFDDDMVFAQAQVPTYSLFVPVPDGEEIELFDGRLKSLGKFNASRGRIEAKLHTGLFKVVSGSFSRHFAIAAGATSNVDLR